MDILGNRLLAHFNHTTDWTFTTSSGFSLGFAYLQAGGGSLYLKNSSTKEETTLRYGSAGASIGLAPASFSYSTADMWSVGLGSIRAAKASLSADDMRGPMCILSGSVLSMSEGLSVSYYFLGFPVGLALLGGAIEIVISGLLTARAFGAMAGHSKGTSDAGFSLLPGYAH